MKKDINETNVEQEETAIAPVETALKSNEDIFLENIQSKNPDLDRDGIFGRANDNYSSLKKGVKTYEETTDLLNDAINAEPEAANLVKMLARYPNQLAFVLKSNFDKEFLQEIVDNYDEIDADETRQQEFESYKASRAERKQQAQANEEYINSVSENGEKSQKVIEEYATASGYKVEDVIQTIVEEFINPVLQNNITPEFLEVIMKGKNFDKKVEEIANENYEQGIIDAKNEKIEEVKLTKSVGDGTIVPSNIGITQTKGKSQPKVPEMFEGIEEVPWDKKNRK